jgi:GDPmannose 4,6-dehydratase
MTRKVAFITGISGQDGTYLTPLLLDQGYEVHGLIRRASNDPLLYLNDIFAGKNVRFHYGSLQDANRISALMQEIQPTEIYNLAAQSHVGISFQCPDETWDINYYGVGRIVNEALKVNPQMKIYQASTSEMFGNTPSPQNELSTFNPQSPYAEAKLRAHQDFIVNKRNTMNAFTVSGILFNHESPRRGKQFVTRKITYTLARIAAGLQTHLELGNLNSMRDWGHAEDYVRAMYLMLQHDKPEDFVIASGKSHSVRDFVNFAASFFDIELEWQGENEAETGLNKKTGALVVRVNKEFYRPKEVNSLQGDASKAKKILGWEPTHSFESLVQSMAEADKALVAKESQ